MTSRAMVFLSVAALTVTGCGRSEEPAAPQVDNSDAANSALNDNAAVAAPTTAQGFVNAAAASDRFELESSRLASASGSSAAVKAFADNMIKAHTASTAKLKTAVASLSTPVTINDALNPNQQSLLDGLKGKSGAELDAAYATAQVTAHQATLDALNDYAASGDNPQLKQFANGMIPTVTAHLNTAKGLK